jgi:hypothetical protein
MSVLTIGAVKPTVFIRDGDTVRQQAGPVYTEQQL